MRNATQADVDLAKQSGKLQENVMYGAYGEKYHGKQVNDSLTSLVHKYYIKMYADKTGHIVIAETKYGVLEAIRTNDLYPLANGEATQPKKEKRKPIKGTKPWPAYNPRTIKVGDKVRLRNGKIAKVSLVSEHKVATEDSEYWLYLENGRCHMAGKHGDDIVGMYQEPEPVYYTHENMPVGKVCRHAHIDGKSRLYRPHINVWYAIHPEDEEPHYGIMHYCDTGDLILADE